MTVDLKTKTSVFFSKCVKYDDIKLQTDLMNVILILIYVVSKN